MAMYGPNFRKFYEASSKAAKESDTDYFFSAWREAYGYAFNDSCPWNADEPKRKVPAICTKVKTRMLSHGCSATDADRVLKYFKKWYKDMYE